jgi:hypothetical protein
MLRKTDAKHLFIYKFSSYLFMSVFFVYLFIYSFIHSVNRVSVHELWIRLLVHTNMKIPFFGELTLHHCVTAGSPCHRHHDDTSWLRIMFHFPGSR